ncbi:hypothetical protein ACG7TL_000481 [Trametes sanguinea]
MSSQQSDYTPSQLARPGEDPEYVGYAIAHDNYEIQKAEQKRDANDEDYSMPDSQEESQDDYDPSPSQETQSSQASYLNPAGSQRQQTPPPNLPGDDDEWNEANGDTAGAGYESPPSSQNPVIHGETLANGKLDGEKLCKIAQVYKARRATGPQEAFQMIPSDWDFIVKVLYGLTEEEMKATKAFLRANLTTLFRAKYFKPTHWAKAEEEARRTWHIYLEEVRYQLQH